MPPKPPEIYRRLLAEGWEDHGGRGSHRKLVRDGVTIILPYHRTEMKRGLWEKIRRQAGWDVIGHRDSSPKTGDAS